MSGFFDLPAATQRRASWRRLVRYLRRTIAPFHPYLRERYRQAGIDLSQLRSEDDFRRLPILEPAELRADPTRFILTPRVPGETGATESLPPFQMLRYLGQAVLNRPADPARLCREQTWAQRIRRRALLDWNPVHFHASSGTTGKPIVAAYTHRDLHAVLPQLAGLTVLKPKIESADRPKYDWTDRGMNLFPGAPHLGYFGSVLAKWILGLPSFDTGGGHVIPTDRQVTLFAAGKFSALVGVPSYVLHWLRRATQLQAAGQVQPLAELRHILLGAEPLSPLLRAAIRETALAAGADPRVLILETMGMTELRWWFAECAPGSGLHLDPRFYYWELLDPQTREPVPEGAPGVLVFSHIGWHGTALIRYWTGDLIKGGMRWDRCPECGYTFPRLFGPICRAERDFTKLKGTRVDLQELLDTVRGTPDVRGFQIVLDHEVPHQPGRDVLRIHVVPEATTARETVAALLRRRVKEATEVTPDQIVWEDDETAFQARLFARNGIKAELCVDRRV